MAWFGAYVQVLERSAHVARQANDVKTLRALEPAFQWRNQLEQSLVRDIARANSVESEAFLQRFRLLCGISSKHSLSVVVEFLPYRNLQNQILSAVVRCGDAALIGDLAFRLQSIEKQSFLLSELLSRGDQESFRAYLNVVRNLDSISVVQSSAVAARSLPVNYLFEALLSNRIQTSRIAATVLATRADVAISNRLCQLAMNPHTARPAIFALAARTDETSVRFINRATQDLTYRAIVQSESRNWRQLVRSDLVVSSEFTGPVDRL